MGSPALICSALALVLCLTGLGSPAYPQSQPIFQIRPAVPGDIPKIRANGQLEDAGGLLGDLGGGRGVNPFSILDAGGLGLSFNTAKSSAPGTYNALRIGHDGVDGLISVNSFGGAPIGGLKCQINDGPKFDCFTGIITDGAVTSITFTGDGTVLSSTPSAAVTSTGTLTATLNTQAAGTVLAGPVSGPDALPTFRPLDATDLPVIIPSVVVDSLLAITGDGTAKDSGILSAGGYQPASTGASDAGLSMLMKGGDGGATAGDGGAWEAQGGAATAAATSGGLVTLRGGTGTIGGGLELYGGTATGTIGGNVRLWAGDAVTDGGDVSIAGGFPTDGIGGAISIVTGAGVGAGASKHAGDLSLRANDGAGTDGDGGAITVTAGEAGGTGDGGSIAVTAGSGGATGGLSGSVSLRGADAGVGGGAAGGAVEIRPGAGDGAGVDGNLLLHDLPSADPAVTDAIWTDSGILVKSGSALFSAAHTWSGEQTFGPVIGSIGNAGAVVSGTTYTFVAGDCGKTTVFTSSSAVTATIPASIVPATTVCAMAVLQAGTAKVSVNGSAVSPATLISESSFTGTSGTAGSMIGLTLLTVSAATNAYLTGSGS